MFRDQIFSLFDKRDGVVVFPTENSARYYLGEYVRARHTTVPADIAMAFDTFSSIFKPRHQELKSATKFHRIAFVSDFMERRSDLLRYFYNPAFPDSRDRFIPFLVSILPSVRIRNRSAIRNRAILADLSLLYEAYSDFLETNGLFEPGFEEPEVPDRLPAEKYYLVGYDAEPPMQQLVTALGCPDFIETVPSGLIPEGRISQFDNENAELLFLFDRICTLRDEGVPDEDIILTTPDVERLRPFIKRVAAARSVPVSFVSEPPLTRTLPGIFLSLVEGVYNDEFSFFSLERLLLDSALPYTEENRARNRELICFMIDNNIIRGSQAFGREDQLYHELGRNEALQKHYGSIKSSIVSLFGAADGAAASKALHGLATYLFSAEEFLSSDEYDDRAVFSFILGQMDTFSRILSSLPVKLGSSFFRLFMSELPSIPYTRQGTSGGIRIYSYAQSYLMDVKYHFVFALSDKNTRIVSRDNAFLEEYETCDTSGIDVTIPLLTYYQGVSEHAYLSTSRETYAGSASAPALFAGLGHVDKAHYSGDASYDTPIMAESFKAAKPLAFNRNTSASDIGLELKLPYQERPVISYSVLDSYVTCPFLSGISLLTPMNNNRDVFEPAFMDHRKIGSFLHRVVQNFLACHEGRMLVDAERDEYKNEIRKEFMHQLEHFHFDTYTSIYLVNAYMSTMESFVDETLGKLPGFIFRSEETRLEASFDGYTLKGFADTLAESQGDCVIIDYKKGDARANAKTYQLLLYRKLLEKKEGKHADILLYFSFKNGSYLPSSEDEELQDKMENDIALTVEGYRSGEWKYTDIRDNCSGCALRSICRRRFFIQ